MKQFCRLFLLTMLISMVGAKAYAYDIAVENADGVIIYYNYINDGTELEVTEGSYEGSVVIPDEVSYMNTIRKVTSIGHTPFKGCTGLTSVTIPNSVTYIGGNAFEGCTGLKKVVVSDIAAWCGIEFSWYYSNPLYYAKHLYSDDNTEIMDLIIPNSVTSIGRWAFRGCSGFTSVTIPNSVTIIDDYAFEGCTGLTSVNIPNSVTIIDGGAFEGCTGLTSVNIPNSVTSISGFQGCTGLTSITIPNSVTNIGGSAFKDCTGLTSITIPNSVTSIGGWAFMGCTGLTSITIPNSVRSIGTRAFGGVDFLTIFSLIEDPFKIDGKSSKYSPFSPMSFVSATLYVPKGTINKYRATGGWWDFLYIEEATGPSGGDDTPTPVPTPVPTPTPALPQCAKPTICYQNGKLTFNCDTEGAVCQYSISDDDIKAGSSNEVQLGVTYHISVYATKEGFKNSETATATLCWIDVEPRTEGITDGIAQMAARAIMVKAEGGQLSIEGAEDDTKISVYSIDGVQVGTTTSRNGIASINTSISKDSVAIVKIGNKSVKVIMK